jgi:hypothetical protein
MVNELELIQMLERVARLVETGQNEMAVATIDKMIYDLCVQVEQFELEMAPAY